MTRTSKKKNAALIARENARPKTTPTCVETDPNRLPASTILRGDYTAHMRSLSMGRYLLIGGVGLLLRLVLTYFAAQFAMRFAVLFATREGHLAFADLAQNAASQGADLNMLMNETMDVTAIGAALGALFGVAGVVVVWRVLTLGWWALVTRSGDVLSHHADRREARLAERQDRIDAARERREERSARRSKATATSGSTKATEAAGETTEADAEAVSARG